MACRMLLFARAAMIEAGRRLFKERGYDATTVADIAAARLGGHHRRYLTRARSTWQSDNDRRRSWLARLDRSLERLHCVEDSFRPLGVRLVRAPRTEAWFTSGPPCCVQRGGLHAALAPADCHGSANIEHKSTDDRHTPIRRVRTRQLRLPRE
jgi:hypothetical protein